MKNSIKCCISCILPCGVLDVIRIVHSNGRVEEFSHTILASEVMKANPKHILRKASSDGVVPKIVIVPPEAELQRGKIYFLMPVVSQPQKTRSAGSTTTKRKKRSREMDSKGSSIAVTKPLISDQYLTELMSENKSTQRDRRRGRVGVWRPHLESISEAQTYL